MAELKLFYHQDNVIRREQRLRLSKESLHYLGRGKSGCDII